MGDFETSYDIPVSFWDAVITNKFKNVICA